MYRSLAKNKTNLLYGCWVNIIIVEMNKRKENRQKEKERKGKDYLIILYIYRINSYAEDLVVCVALGVDMFDCVYPTRTAVSYDFTYIHT